MINKNVSRRSEIQQGNNPKNLTVSIRAGYIISPRTDRWTYIFMLKWNWGLFSFE